MNRLELSRPAVLLAWTGSHPSHERTWTFSLLIPQHMSRNYVRLCFFGVFFWAVIGKHLEAMWGVIHPRYTSFFFFFLTMFPAAVFLLIHPGHAASFPSHVVSVGVRLLTWVWLCLAEPPGHLQSTVTETPGPLCLCWSCFQQLSWKSWRDKRKF